jgi:hypothetical protein
MNLDIKNLYLFISSFLYLVSLPLSVFYAGNENSPVPGYQALLLGPLALLGNPLLMLFWTLNIFYYSLFISVYRNSYQLLGKIELSWIILVGCLLTILYLPRVRYPINEAGHTAAIGLMYGSYVWLLALCLLAIGSLTLNRIQMEWYPLALCVFFTAIGIYFVVLSISEMNDKKNLSLNPKVEFLNKNLAKTLIQWEKNEIDEKILAENLADTCNEKGRFGLTVLGYFLLKLDEPGFVACLQHVQDLNLDVGDKYDSKERFKPTIIERITSAFGEGKAIDKLKNTFIDKLMQDPKFFAHHKMTTQNFREMRALAMSSPRFVELAGPHIATLDPGFFYDYGLDLQNKSHLELLDWLILNSPVTLIQKMDSQRGDTTIAEHLIVRLSKLESNETLNDRQQIIFDRLRKIVSSTK